MAAQPENTIPIWLEALGVVAVPFIWLGALIARGWRQVADHERRLNEHDVKTVHMDDKLDRLIQSRMEDRERLIRIESNLDHLVKESK